MEIKKVTLLNEENLAKNLSIGSCCVIIQDNKVLLVKGKGGADYKFPGGHIIDDENFKESGQRETFEEISCKVNIIGDPIFYLFKFDDVLDIILIHYLAEIAEGEPKPTTEIDEIGWFDLNNMPENIFGNILPVLEEIRKSIV